MPRPAKQGLDYFPMDTILDDDTQLLITEIGAEGFGILVILMQIIYANEGYYTVYDKKLPLKVRQKCLSSVETIVSVIKKALEYEFFNEKMFENYQILTSRGIQKRYFSAAKKKTKIEVDPRFLLIDVSDAENIVFSYENPDNFRKNDTNKSKVNKNKSKVKENRIDSVNSTESVDNNKSIKGDNIYIAQSCKNTSEPAANEDPPLVVIPLNGKVKEFPITQQMVDSWQKDFPSVDVLGELRKMHAWSEANPKKRKTINGVKRFIVSWLSREQDRIKQYNKPSPDIGGDAAFNSGYFRKFIPNLRLVNNEEALRKFLEKYDNSQKEAAQ